MKSGCKVLVLMGIVGLVAFAVVVVKGYSHTKDIDEEDFEDSSMLDEEIEAEFDTKDLDEEVYADNTYYNKDKIDVVGSFASFDEE